MKSCSFERGRGRGGLLGGRRAGEGDGGEAQRERDDESVAHDGLLRLPQERFAVRRIRAVDLLVAVDAAAPDDPRAPVLHRQVVVDGRRVARADVTALAEHRRLRHEHAVVVAAMRIVAGDAAVRHRCGFR